MRTIAVCVVVVGLFLAGCDFGSRDQQPVYRESSVSVSESDARRGQNESVRGDVVAETTHMTTAEESLLLSFVFRWWWWVAYYGVGVVIGIFVYRDARTRPKLAMNIRPIWWCIVAILDAPLGLLVYWVLNHSNLRIRQDMGGDELPL